MEGHRRVQQHLKGTTGVSCSSLKAILATLKTHHENGMYHCPKKRIVKYL